MPSPVAELDEHAAVSGVAIVTGQLGSSLGTGAAVAEWVTGKVQWVQLTASDGGYTGKTTAFLSGFENPVPVMLDPRRHAVRRRLDERQALPHHCVAATRRVIHTSNAAPRYGIALTMSRCRR